MKRNTEDRSSHSSALFAIDVVRDGAEPKAKREESADLTWWFNPSRASIDSVSCNLRPTSSSCHHECSVRRAPARPTPFLLKDADIAI
jgi:hypothetical protein